jgi:3-isopropylmalate/(R)-2-methylmalate dehydratase small subunit
MKLSGKAWKFGDDVNTDLIIPGKYLELIDPQEMAKHAMEGADPTFVDRFNAGDLIVGGRNFGCGSSREHAPLALKYAGVGAVLAESYARIFFRNAINVGLPAFVCPGINADVDDGDSLDLDTAKGIVENRTTGQTLNFSPLPEFMVEILNEGGLVTYLKSHMDEW